MTTKDPKVLEKERDDAEQARQAAEAKAKQEADARAKAETELATAKAQIAAAAKEKQERESAAITTEAKTVFKETLGREPTDEEVAAYQASTPEGRKVLMGTLREAKVNRDKLIEKAGLTEEQVKGESNAARAALAENGLVQAAVRLGLADPIK